CANKSGIVASPPLPATVDAPSAPPSPGMPVSMKQDTVWLDEPGVEACTVTVALTIQVPSGRCMVASSVATPGGRAVDRLLKAQLRGGGVGAPAAPLGPAEPVGPRAPVSPVGPCSPSAPAGPGSPCSPCEPVAPVAPVSPWRP